MDTLALDTITTNKQGITSLSPLSFTLKAQKRHKENRIERNSALLFLPLAQLESAAAVQTQTHCAPPRSNTINLVCIKTQTPRSATANSANFLSIVPWLLMQPAGQRSRARSISLRRFLDGGRRSGSGQILWRAAGKIIVITAVNRIRHARLETYAKVMCVKPKCCTRANLVAS